MTRHHIRPIFSIVLSLQLHSPTNNNNNRDWNENIYLYVGWRERGMDIITYITGGNVVFLQTGYGIVQLVEIVLVALLALPPLAPVTTPLATATNSQHQ